MASRVLFIAAAPTYLMLFTPFGGALTGLYTRIAIVTIFSLLVASLTTHGEHLFQRANFFLGFLLVGSLFYFGQQFGRVSNYPFSLTWSEGNRMYDYSLYLGKDRYITTSEIVPVWGSPGRYLLWGIIYGLPNTPIWLHRLWDAILWTVPYLVLGYTLARWRDSNRLARWVFILWIFLFLAQGPIYAPLVLSALIVVLMVRPNHIFLSLVGVAIAGYYAASSRWTWSPAPAVWAALILLADFDIRKNEPWGKFVIRLLPVVLVTGVGLAGGILADPTLFLPQELSGGVLYSQPLLWYRLLPNATYTEGIILGLVIAIIPLLVLMIWLYASRRWPLNWLQALAFVSALLAFLAIGLVASVKIGGGSNLHNLDMLLVTLAILSGLMLRKLVDFDSAKWPLFGQFILFLTVLLPVGYIIRSGSPLVLPSDEVVNKALRNINNLSQIYKENGEVLLLDQRQLLTFGYLEDIPLTEDYEKKFVMNQAMADNAAYFEAFYTDLANKRFSIIVTETLFTRIRGSDDTFGDENDAWVKWVSEPMLCYYKPIKRFPGINVQILQPRDEPKNCPDYAIVNNKE